MSSPIDKMYSARVSLVLDQPFWGHLALHLKLREDPTCETAWTDGRTFGFNPTFIESLDHEQRTALCAHEVSHVALGHPWRRDSRESDGWNIACDKTVNNELRDAGFKMPPDPWYATGDEEGKSAEWIYNRRQEKEDDDPQGQGNGQGQGQQGNGKPDPLGGEVRDAPTDTDDDGEPAPTEQDWKQHATEAMQHAKMAGKMPGGMERLVKDAIKTPLDIRALLLRFFSERSMGDYTWKRPNVRYLPQGLYLPTLESHELGEVAIMVDTSGSIDDVALGFARAQVQSVLEECNPAGVTLYFADAAVKHIHRMEKGEPLTWEPQGGGGTDFRPALAAIEEDENKPVCVVCISDLDGTFPEQAPDTPVLWLSTDANRTAPFGETVSIDY